MWREGDATVALALPGTEVQLMLDANDPDAPVGPLFVVDSVEAFHAARPDALAVVEGPSEIPGGFLATYKDPGGATHLRHGPVDGPERPVNALLLPVRGAPGPRLQAWMYRIRGRGAPRGATVAP